MHGRDPDLERVDDVDVLVFLIDLDEVEVLVVGDPLAGESRAC